MAEPSWHSSTAPDLQQMLLGESSRGGLTSTVIFLHGFEN